MKKILTAVLILNMVPASSFADGQNTGPYSSYQNPMGVSPGEIKPDAFPEKNINPEQVCASIDQAMNSVIGKANEEAYCARREIALDPFAMPSAPPATSAASGAGDGSWSEGANVCSFQTQEGCPIRVKKCLPDPGTGNAVDWTTSTASEDCKTAQKKINSCKYAKIGSDKQVRMYCLARNQASKGKKALASMAILDGTAAALCAADCFNPNEASRKAMQLCGVAALGAGAQEFFQITRMLVGGFNGNQKQFAGDYKIGEGGVTEKQLSGVVRIGTRVSGAVSTSKQAITGYKMATEYNKVCFDETGKARTNDDLDKLKEGDANKAAYDDLTAKSDKAAKGIFKKMGKANASDNKCQAAQRQVACSAMRTFGVLAGVRYYSLTKAKKTVTEADKAIYAMMGQKPPVTGKSSGGSSGGGGGLFGGNSGGNSGFDASGMGTGSGSGSSTASGWGNASDNGPLSFGAIDSNNIDGKLLQGPLGRRATDKALKEKWTEAKLDKAMAGGASGMMSSIGASMGLGSKMNEATNFAATSAKFASNDGVDLGTAYANNSGGKKSSEAASEDMGLGLGNEEASTETASNEMSFGRNLASDEEDIWHTGSGESIFQIISKKYTKVNGRVQ